MHFLDFISHFRRAKSTGFCRGKHFMNFLYITSIMAYWRMYVQSVYVARRPHFL